MNRLVLIDGNAILHRAYHALPPLTAPDGSMVNAVYGFVSMLFKLVNDLRPTHLAVAFDRPAPTFRKKLFKAYQSQRPEMDKELVSQVEKVHEVIESFGIPIFEVDGFEADDIIGTLSRQIPDQVVIVTGDKDLLQLVDGERVLVYMPVKGLLEAKLFGEKEVKEKLGVAPKQVPDFKALAGDASDNYPGVAGIGPKTAALLLVTYGSLAKLYQAVKKKKSGMSLSVRAKLEKGIGDAELGQELATIRTDAPIPDAPLKAIGSLDTREARNVLGSLHFHSLLKRLTGVVEKNKEEHVAKKTRQKKETTDQQQVLF